MAKNYKKDIEMMRPKISVIMPVYNVEAYVGDAIDSIVNQTFIDWELIIVNDGSSDATAEKVRQYTDKRIVFIDNPHNKKKPACLNQAIAIARGDYFIIMDGDDKSLPDRLQKKYEYMESHPQVVACGCQLKRFGNSDIQITWPTTYEDIYLGLLTACIVNIPIVRMSTYKKHNLFFDENMLAEDYLMWIKLANLGEIVALPDVLYLYRTHEKQMSQNNKRNIDKDVRLEKNLMFALFAQKINYLLPNDFEFWKANFEDVESLRVTTSVVHDMICDHSKNPIFDTNKVNYQLSKLWYRQFYNVPKRSFRGISILLRERALRNNAKIGVKNIVFYLLKQIGLL